MWPYSQFPANLVTFTEEILNGKLPKIYEEASFESPFYLSLENVFPMGWRIKMRIGFAQSFHIFTYCLDIYFQEYFGWSVLH